MKALIGFAFAVLTSSAVANESARWSVIDVPLGANERITRAFVVPSSPVVRVEEPADVLAAPRSFLAPAPHEIDAATRKPRNRSGWTGQRAPAAGVACFPHNAC